MPLFGAGRHGDGNLYVAFLQMGQGDCTVAVCPNGKIVMIDCGSTSLEYPSAIDEIKDVLRKEIFAGRSRIDALILTHADEDHHNRVVELLGPSIKRIPRARGLGVQVGAVYHSGNLKKYNKGTVGRTDYLVNYNGLWPKKAITLRVRDVNAPLGPIEATIGGASLHVSDGGLDMLDSRNRVQILDGTRIERGTGGPECGVYILASNVAPYTTTPGDGSTAANRGSVVTLIEFNGERILVCGDATTETERFLREQQAAHVTDLLALRIAHHGSDTSSSPAFVQMANPQHAYISVKQKDTDYHLPLSSVVERYLDPTTQTRLLSCSSHPVSMWDEAEPISEPSKRPGDSRKRIMPDDTSGRKRGKQYTWEERQLARALFCTGWEDELLLKVPAVSSAATSAAASGSSAAAAAAAASSASTRELPRLERTPAPPPTVPTIATLDQLKTVVRGAIQDATFRLPLGSLGSNGVNEWCLGWCPNDELRLKDLGPVQDTPSADRITVTGTGDGGAFDGLRVTATFQLEAGEAALVLTATGDEHWGLATAFPDWENTPLGALQCAGSPTFALASYRFSGPFRAGLSFQGQLRGTGVFPGLEYILGGLEPRLTGAIRLEQGLPVTTLRGQLTPPVKLGFLTFPQVLLEACSEFVPPSSGDSPLVHAFLRLSTTISFSAQGVARQIPLSAIIYDPNSSIQLKAGLADAIAAALDELETLVDRVGLVPLLPKVNFELEKIIRLTDLNLWIDPSSPNKLAAMSLIIESAQTWDLLSNLGHAGLLQVGDLELAFRLDDPLGARTLSAGIQGVISIGSQGKLLVAASYPDYSLDGGLIEGTTISLPEILSQFLPSVPTEDLPRARGGGPRIRRQPGPDLLLPDRVEGRLGDSSRGI